MQRLSESLVAEIEARSEADTLAEKALGFVLAEAKRVAQQFVDAERSATSCAADAAASTRKAVAGESEVLSLEAQALSARVSSTMQRGLHSATEDLASAQRKEKKAVPGSGGAVAAQVQEVAAGGVESGERAVDKSTRVGQGGERAPTPGKMPESPSKTRVDFSSGHYPGSPGG